jgi:hypothetical protein
LHARPDAVVIVLGLNKSDRDVRLVVEDEVSAFLFSARMEFPPNINSSISEADFLANLRVNVPARRHEIGRDELGDYVAFAEVFLIHAAGGFGAGFLRAAVGLLWRFSGWKLILPSSYYYRGRQRLGMKHRPP